MSLDTIQPVKKPKAPRAPSPRRALIARIRHLRRLVHGIQSGVVFVPDLLHAIEDAAAQIDLLASQFLVRARYAELRNFLTWIHSNGLDQLTVSWPPLTNLQPATSPHYPGETRHSVPSDTGTDVYTITHRDSEWICTCPHWTIHRIPCKHIARVQRHPTWYPFQPARS